jgi:autotransporter-associated beta strand protein
LVVTAPAFAAAEVGTLADAGLVVWGDDFLGRYPVPAGYDFTQVAAGYEHAVALRRDGTIVAWGDNTYHQLDSVPTASGFRQIAAGDNHSLALKPDGTAVAWGANDRGQCAVPTGQKYTQVAGGGFHSVGLKPDGSLAAWGWDNSGQCNVPSGKNYTQVAAGAIHSLALKSDGSIAGWGWNNGQWNFPAGNQYTTVAGGFEFSVALAADGSLVAAGRNPDYLDVPAGSDFTQVTADYYHGVAVRSDGSLAAWGPDMSGEVQNTPTSGYYLAVAAGYDFNVALQAREAYEDLLVSGTGRGAILNRNVNVSGNATIQSTMILENHPLLSVAGITAILGDVTGAGTISSGSFVLEQGTIGAALAGPGGVTKSGPGTATLATANAYHGPTLVNEGTLVIGSIRALPWNSDVMIGAGAQLALADGLNTAYASNRPASVVVVSASPVPEPGSLGLGLAAAAIALLAAAARRNAASPGRK